jgi:SAM-dependent methyltransferase
MDPSNQYDPAVTTTPSAHAINQYATTTGRLTARIALHAYGTNPQDWFSWLSDRLPLTGDVLEVGAGTGRLWTQVDHATRGLSLTLTDFSAAMCDQLRAIPGARVQRCDAANLPFADASFDTLIANHMLYHLDDPTVALREFARVVRRQGRLAVATNGAGHLAELDAIAEAIGRADLNVWSAHANFAAETGPAFVARYFRDVQVERYPCDLDIPAVEPVVAYLDSVTEQPLTPRQRTNAVNLVQQRIDTDGRFLVGKHTVLITASR